VCARARVYLFLALILVHPLLRIRVGTQPGFIVLLPRDEGIHDAL